jgi:2-polyprenyl-6-methoxyphenol hydroxylase-like FAD-dependent oxidoreductase
MGGLACATALARTGRAVLVIERFPASSSDIEAFFVALAEARSSAEVMNHLVADPRLRAVLLAQKGNYSGAGASEISFGVHALVMSHYFNGG